MFLNMRRTYISCHKYLHDTGGRFLSRRNTEIQSVENEQELEKIVLENVYKL